LGIFQNFVVEAGSDVGLRGKKDEVGRWWGFHTRLDQRVFQPRKTGKTWIDNTTRATTMESWRNGRDDLLDYITKACNRIDENIRAGRPISTLLNPGNVLIHVVIELDDENFTTVARDELRYLRERNSKTDLLEEENTRLAENLKGYNDASLRVEALEEENKRLAGVLEKALQQQKSQSPGTPGDSQTPRGSEPPSSVRKIEDHESNAAAREKYNALVEKHNKLIVKYNLTSTSYGELKNARQLLEDEFRKEKQKVKDFTLHVELKEGLLTKRAERIRKQEEEIRRLRANLDGYAILKLHSPKSVKLITSSPVSSRAEIQVPISPTKLMPEEDVEAESPELPNLLQEGNFHVEDTLYVPIEAGHASSTQDEASSPRRPSDRFNTAMQQPLPEHPPSDDIPVVIEARSVKKRKGRHEEVKDTGTPVAKVKLERINSSPIGIAAMYHMNESIDLDDIGEKVDTPKKQRRMLELSRQASRVSNGTELQRTRNTQSQSQSNLASEFIHEVSQETPVRRTRVSRTGSALQLLSTNRQILPRTSEDKPRAPKKRRLVSDEAIGELGEDGPDLEKTPRRPTNGGAERLDSLLKKPSPPKRVLSPIQAIQAETPKAINQHTRSKASATSGLAREIRNSNGYESDGATSTQSRMSRGSLEPTRPLSRGTPRVSAGHSRPSSRGSLRGPAEPTRPFPETRDNRAEQLSRPDREHPKTPVNGSRPISRDSRHSAGPSKPTSSIGQNPKPGEISAKRNPRPRANAMGLRWDTLENEPLRTRPVGVLGLDDFKVNPVYNQGYDYAFKDVVRKKDERRCLPGCTRPECCGNKFRALAQLLQDTASDRPHTLSQEERDQELLEEFMGDNAYKLNNMSADDRKEMLLQAKTRDLANKNGRHRHAYDRRPSPPGFWQADFPTTQEEMDNREKSKEYVQRLVEERYAEAMRPGGAYIFRDE
jgi:hypothetical protein